MGDNYYCNHRGKKEVKVVIPDVHDDQRGYFFESYNSKSFETHLIPHLYLQDNEVKSKKSTLRGLHYQLNNPQGKLVRVVSGEILDVAVDIRLGSPNFGKHVIKKLSSQNKRMLYVPEGFAHGYIVLSEESIVIYKCTNVWIPNDELCETGFFGIEFECTWDIEHTCGIRIKNREKKKAGLAFDAY